LDQLLALRQLSRLGVRSMLVTKPRFN
jgi:hypothetical protein